MTKGEQDSGRQRLVANMSPTQVSRKRSIDRENQRNHRAKNKTYIRELETKVAGLTFKLIRAEEQLRQLENHQPPPPLHHHQNFISASDSLSQSSTRSPAASTEHATQSLQQAFGGASQMSDLGTTAISMTTSAEDIFTFDDAFNGIPLDFGSGIAIQAYDSTVAFSFDDFAPSASVAINDTTTTSNHKGVSASSLPSVSETGGTMYFQHQQHHQQQLSEGGKQQRQVQHKGWGFKPAWQQLPLNSPSTNNLERIIINLTQQWRERFLKSQPRLPEFGEAIFPSISSLLDQRRNDEGGEMVSRPVLDAVAAQVSSSPIMSLMERLAFMYKLSHYVRWLVCQTEETYNYMPEYLRPTHLQRTVRHPAWIDIISWPDARDALIRHTMRSGDEKGPEVFSTYKRLTGLFLSVNWPYPDSGATTESHDGKAIRLNPLFESHIRDLSNWSCGQEVGETFPFMQPYCKLRD